MNGVFKVTILSILSIVFHAEGFAQSIGINSTGNNPDVSAGLDVSFTNMGVLVPRVALVAINSSSPVSSPANSLLVYNTATSGTSPNDVVPGFYYWDSSSSKWIPIKELAELVDLDRDTKVQVEESSDEDIIRFDMQGVEYFVMNAGRLEVKNTGGAVFIGDGAGANDDLSGNGNVFIGLSSGSMNTSGANNVAIGSSSLQNNTTGNNNTAVGTLTMTANTIGSSNTALGHNSLSAVVSGGSNTAVGAWSLFSTTATNNTGVGTSTLFSNTTGVNNVAVGAEALYNNTTGAQNTAVGKDALWTNTDGYWNTAIGQGSMQSNTSGNSNTAVGLSSLRFNTSGIANTAIGYIALNNNTTGVRNTAVGVLSSYSNTSGNWNVSQGVEAARFNKSGNNNTSIGYQTNYYDTIGSSNTSVGFQANYFNQNSSNNTLVGYQAGHGSGFHNKSGNVFIGYKAGMNEHGSNLLYIENSNSSTPLVWGDFANNRVGINRVATTNALEVGGEASKATAGNWLANSDERLKKEITGLNEEEMLTRLLELKGITYKWDDQVTGNIRPEEVQYGFTAQNIQEVFPTLVSEDQQGYLQTSYGTFDAMTVEAIRELNNRVERLMDENSALKQERDTQNATIETLESNTSELESRVEQLEEYLKTVHN